jgi:hypothetical protein
MSAAPDFPPAEAVIVAVPGPTPVTSPVLFTAATLLFDEPHTKLGEDTGFDLATSWTVCPA